MKITWLGWAGVEIEHEGVSVVVDPLQDARAVFAPLGERVEGTPAPEVIGAQQGQAIAGLVTHLHRDHADAAALASALAPGAPIFEPPAGGGDTAEELSLLQAETELAATGITRHRTAAWTEVSAGPFTLTALPAVDATGDPQVSWLVEAGGVRVLHLGDTMFHGYWWRFAHRFGPIDLVLTPVNGAVLSFPHRQPASPLPAVMTPEQAAIACEILGARKAMPIHADGYDVGGIYTPVSGAAALFAEAARGRGVDVSEPQLGEAFELEAATA